MDLFGVAIEDLNSAFDDKPNVGETSNGKDADVSENSIDTARSVAFTLSLFVFLSP